MLPSMFPLAIPPLTGFPAVLGFGLGPTEMLFIGGIIVLLFGARKLPELARSMGSSVTQFKKGLKDPDSLPPGTDKAEGSGEGEEPRQEGS